MKYFTKLKCWSVKSISSSFKRNTAILHLVLKGSEQCFADLCHALCETNQHHLVANYLTCPALVAAGKSLFNTQTKYVVLILHSILYIISDK